MKLNQIFKTTPDNKLEVSVEEGITVSGDSSVDVTGLAQDATLTNGTQRAIVEGKGTPGSPTGGVITVQGDPSGTPIDVTGTFFTSISAVGVNGAPAPASSIEIGVIDSTGKLQGAVGVTTNPIGSELGLVVRPIPSGTQTISGVTTSKISNTHRWGPTIAIPASATSIQLLPANSNRVGGFIVNNSASGIMYISFGPTASVDNFTLHLLPGINSPGGILELPQPIYAGIISAIWDIASGGAMVTEAVY